ncbi:MAG: histidyl-tRNA synthase [Candidatus Scalindua rubra]|uniref:Histidine--tRNA ligase n=1 Tax=Candidatus Scalindua rubra TaxID=1872076 RepID=A0A1E3X646_9BACT|nr:MAG: histidyl-tRNA synthase [Candidatus Scalindua rubra]
MKDIFPNERQLWIEMENAAREEFELGGYCEIKTPVFEDTRLFVRSIGETTDIVEKEMYTFGDTAESTITLRPENTAPVMRAYLEYELYKTKKFQKFYYIGPMFRRERPQAGRLRQFHQMGIEAIGSYEPLLDVETIKIATRVYDRLELSGYEVKINSIGCEKCRPGFRNVLKEELVKYKDELCELCKVRLDRNVFRVLDCKQKKCKEACKNISTIEEHICKDCHGHFNIVKSALKDIELEFELDPHLVRGLDYYTKTVYEITHPSMGARDTICAGGRYDNLISDIGGPPTGAVGFAAGMEASMIAIVNTRKKGPKRKPDTLHFAPDVYIVSIGTETRNYCFKLLNELRQSGVSVDMDYECRSPKAQMRMANKLKSKFTIVIGSDELEKGVIKLKDMQTGEENDAEDTDKIIQIVKLNK